MNLDKIVQDIDIVAELEARGLSGKVSGRNYNLCCPIHSEKHPSFGINISDSEKRGLFNCLGCGVRGSFFYLIALLDGISVEEAIQKYSKEFKVEDLREYKSDFQKFLEEVGERKGESIKVLNESLLKKYKAPYGDYLKYLTGKERRFTKKTIKKFGILCCDSGVWERRIIIPLRDLRGRLISITARAIDKVDKVYKVRKVKDTDVKKILFGLSFIRKGSRLVLVEGESDCIYLQQFGVPAVSILGNDISDTQLKLIVGFTKRVAVSLDGDIPYVRPQNDPEEKNKPSIKKLKDKLVPFVDVDVVRLPYGFDPNDLPGKYVKKFYKEYVGGVR